MPLGKQIRSPAERSMNIHEKNAVCSRARCVCERIQGFRNFYFSGAGGGRGEGDRNQASGFTVSAFGKTC